jgi:hypothetical protein
MGRMLRWVILCKFACLNCRIGNDSVEEEKRVSMYEMLWKLLYFPKEYPLSHSFL